ncbi:MAG: hypothetical protein HYY17_12325 [Planctomycetes bacterium]|nr:hypothetical protein [Planctomycetota bacterium]
MKRFIGMSALALGFVVLLAGSSPGNTPQGGGYGKAATIERSGPDASGEVCPSDCGKAAREHGSVVKRCVKMITYNYQCPNYFCEFHAGAWGHCWEH